jgi:phosphomannomutase
MSLIRSISGIRATLGSALLPEMITRHISAFAQGQPPGTIVVGRDGRPSGVWIEHIVAGTLSAMGRNVRLLGVVPTPTVQLHAEMDGIAGGISITASHNPAEWNGLKFLKDDGTFLTAEDNARLFACADAGSFSFIAEQQGGEIEPVSSAIDMHIGNIVALPLFQSEEFQLLSLIRQRGLKVVVDAVNCSGSVAVPQLLRTLGCTVIEIHCSGNGVFPHVAEPLPEHLGDLCAAVRTHDADMGIAVDPDADRLVLIDNHGHAVWEEYTIALATLSACTFASVMGDSYSRHAIVNLSTTRAVEDIAKDFGVVVKRSAVGEINVVQAIQRYDALIGGEGSGGVIVPASHAGRDAMVGVALILALRAYRNISLAELVASLPQYVMSKQKIAFTGDVQNILDAIAQHFPTAHHDTTDGLRISFEAERTWVHLRASNTEPIMRVISEAPTKEQADAIAAECMSIVRTLLVSDKHS